MRLSTNFSIDTKVDWVKKHNDEARTVMEAYYSGKPVRVPLLLNEWYGQHGFYADEIGLDYRKYYNDPDMMIQVQLEAARRRREIPMCDMILGEVPECWDTAVDMANSTIAGWFGAELFFRENSVMLNHRLNFCKEQCKELEIPDPVTGGLLKKIYDYRNYLKDRYEGKLQFLGKPVNISHCVGSAGILALALELYGEDIMVDMYEDPEFAHAFLEKCANFCNTLECTWANLAGNPVAPFDISDHGIDMLSPELYEEYLVPLIKKMNLLRRTQPNTNFHYCGRGAHLFPVVKKHFNITCIHNLTFPLVDIAKVRRELGDEVEIIALIEDSIIQEGPLEKIRQTVKDLMTSGAKGKGGLAMAHGDMLRGTPMKHRIAYYEAVKEFGGY